MRIVALPSAWQWWMGSGGGLAARIAIGGAIFAVLAAVDLARHGREANRWREYLFLILAAAVAMAYGAVNDCITSRISWEYFYYGKGLQDELGPRVPPETLALAWGAMKVGMKSTWSAGLILAAAMLIANNPRPNRPSLPFTRLIRLLGPVLLIVLGIAAIGGVIGYSGGLTWLSADLTDLWRQDLFRPRRFMATFGIHLGGYLGGLLGMVWSVWRIRRATRSGHPTRWGELRDKSGRRIGEPARGSDTPPTSPRNG